MAKKTPALEKKLNISINLLFLAAITTLVVAGFLTFGPIFFLNSRFYPFVSVAQTDLSFLKPEAANQKLVTAVNSKLKKELILKSSSDSAQPKEYKFLLSSLLEVDYQEALTQAFSYGHSQFYYKKVELPLNFKYNPRFESQIKSIAQNLNQSPIDSQIKVEGSQITVTPSQNGVELDEVKLKSIIGQYLNTGSIKTNTLPLKTIEPKMSYESGLLIKKRLDAISLSPLKLKFKDRVFTIDLQTVISLLDLENTESSLVNANFLNSSVTIGQVKIGSREYTDTKLKLNQEKVRNYLRNIALSIDRAVQEPLITVEPTSEGSKPRITAFQPPIEGQKLDLDLAYQRLSQALLNQNQTVIELPVTVVKPKNRLSNDLGINELIGQGISNFAGSIPNRIYNINLTAQKLNGALVGPGEVFSFNSTVGDISSESGYKQAYVIKSGRTVLDDGGGVCQDSTTLFRAVLNAGLPVVKRTAHAYRVGYYEQGFPPGLDATIFTPSVDFQFRNDTPTNILIQAYTRGTTLSVDLYGTSDGRQVELSKPVVTNQVPPPEPLYQEDPSLPRGTTKQVDFSAWGANVSFSRTVKRNGEVIISETFKSNYRPWQAVFLVGTSE